MNSELLRVALTQIGIKEFPGSVKNNPEILKYFDATNHSWVRTDETAWCSAGINWVAREAGFERTGELNARSWLDIGEHTDQPDQGTVVIFWREDPNSWKGHVGFWIQKRGSQIWTLGGNQNNSWSIKPYPADRILDTRNLGRAA